MSYRHSEYDRDRRRLHKGDSRHSSERKRRKYSTDSSDSDDEKLKFYDYARQKSKLNKIFFRDEDFVKQGSKEYDEFWQFTTLSFIFRNLYLQLTKDESTLPTQHGQQMNDY